MTSLSTIWPALEAIAREHHVARIGASDLADRNAEKFAQWIERGHHGSMKYLEKNVAVRKDPHARYPWAKSVISILVPYSATRPEAGPAALSNHVARYALADDYHDVLENILKRFEDVIKEADPSSKTWRYVDTGPVSDRAYATQSGLGWIGKNAMLINEEIGSYVFIGTLVTSLANDITPERVADRCGTCTRCLDACPTDAILPDRTVDSNACISYATIEHKGELPQRFEKKLAGYVFGCDICQEVCPWNRAPLEPHPAFTPRDSYRATPVSDLLRFTQEEFSTLFRKSAIKRAKLDGMKRNVDAAADDLT